MNSRGIVRENRSPSSPRSCAWRSPVDRSRSRSRVKNLRFRRIGRDWPGAAPELGIGSVGPCSVAFLRDAGEESPRLMA